MNNQYVFTSLTRISPLEKHSFEIEKLKKDDWNNADYILTEVLSRRNALKVELPNGRMAEVARGDLLVTALGTRFATLETTGSWDLVGQDGEMHLLTGAGLVGKATSRSFMLPSLIRVKYKGHIKIFGHKANMNNFYERHEWKGFTIPIILLVGTSMSAGKTTAAKIIIRELKKYDIKVIGAKLTGAGRYRDVLSMRDSGADEIFDFVDVGLPSSIGKKLDYKIAAKNLLSMMENTGADIAVVEIGASPMEPYNGSTAIDLIKGNIKSTILCASDPYAVYGVMKAFNLKPNLVSGIATNTTAGTQLIEKLCNVKALNIIDPEARPEMMTIIKKGLKDEVIASKLV
jgi:hypothetical protein